MRVMARDQYSINWCRFRQETAQFGEYWRILFTRKDEYPNECSHLQASMDFTHIYCMKRFKNMGRQENNIQCQTRWTLVREWTNQCWKMYIRKRHSKHPVEQFSFFYFSIYSHNFIIPKRLLFYHFKCFHFDSLKRKMS